MRLISRGGADMIELIIEGYQFPQATDVARRYSWHMIRGSAQTADEAWPFRFPALTCAESPQLSQWLRQVAAWTENSDTEQHPADLAFTEPNLSFAVGEHSEGGIALKIQLDLEFVSPAHRTNNRAFDNPNVLHIVTEATALLIAAADWDRNIHCSPTAPSETTSLLTSLTAGNRRDSESERAPIIESVRSHHGRRHVPCVRFLRDTDPAGQPRGGGLARA